MNKNRNVLRCVECGVEIYTEDATRACYKCENRMEFICKESERRKR